MAVATADEKMRALLNQRRIATLATENEDGSIHLTAVWYLFEGDSLYVATMSQSRKARNVAARGKASLMVDVRAAGAERGLTARGRAEILSGETAREIARRVHGRYLSAAALADPQVGRVFEALDDVVIRIRPTSWFTWNMADVDTAVFGGRLFGTPGYLLPLE